MLERMKSKLKHVVMLIIDERSMVESVTMKQAENNIRQSIYNRQNEEETWGGIPIVIVVGDDYQLPPVGNRVINGFWNLYTKPSIQSIVSSEDELKGLRLFLELTNCVISLDQSFQQNKAEKEFQEILQCVQTADTTKTIAKRLMSLHSCKYTTNEWNEIQKDATYIFANVKPKNEHNFKMLSQITTRQNPLALI